ncbi:hypothetical protein AB0K09_29440 [Streptomyces sp. NPDC049577]|uniref:hypothetical protein n=1 Tax=Streptomyces sp. NPDC049577 TaxID=3155153 RepID=UPI00343D4751
MSLSTLTAPAPPLSCYTTNLVSYLEPELPEIRGDFAAAVRLAVRTDVPGGGVAFSHHERVDVTADGRGLAYRGAEGWEEARAALLAELGREGRVLAVGNTAHLPWSPAYGRAAAPHWLLVHDQRDECWLVADHFAALTPHGEQGPYLGWLDDDEMARALTPVAAPAPEVVRRDRLALGRAVPLPPEGTYRWLTRETGGRAASGPAPDEGTWLHGTAALRHLRTVLAGDPAEAERCADDLWAAACHHAHRDTVLAAEGLIGARTAEAAAQAWSALPRSLRFAAQSAARGRPRPGLLEQAFDQLLRVTEELDAQLSQEG